MTLDWRAFLASIPELRWQHSAQVGLLTFIDDQIINQASDRYSIIRHILDRFFELKILGGYSIYLLGTKIPRLLASKRDSMNLPKLRPYIPPLSARAENASVVTARPGIKLLLIPRRGRPYFMIVMKIRAEAELPGSDEFFGAVARQLSILVSKRDDRRSLQTQAKISQVFFDEGLRASACWNSLVQVIEDHFPRWRIPKGSRLFSTQLLIPDPDTPLLKIVAARHTNGIGRLIHSKKSVAGLLVNDPDRKFLRLDPTAYPLYYNRFGRFRPRSELVVKIQHGSNLVGLVNFEHQDINYFDDLFVDDALDIAGICGPFVGGLRARYDSARSREIGQLLVFSNILTHLAATHSHAISQPLFAARMAIDDLKAVATDLPQDGAELVHLTAQAISEFNTVSNEFVERLPSFLYYGKLSISQVLRDVLDNFESVRRKGFLAFTVNMPVGEVYAYGSSLISEHLRSLINNSVDAIMERMMARPRVKGKVKISVDRIVERDRNSKDIGVNSVYLRIVDNGGGVRGDLIDRIGQNGVTTKFNGHGQGLAAARGYFESIGGSMTWKNARGGFQVKIVLQAFDRTLHPEGGPVAEEHVQVEA